MQGVSGQSSTPGTESYSCKRFLIRARIRKVGDTDYMDELSNVMSQL